MRLIFSITFGLIATITQGQVITEVVGDYIKIDSTSSKYEKNGVCYSDIDTTLLSLNKDMSFSYKWSPMFGPFSQEHIITTGTWRIQDQEVILNSKYQQDEYRFFEDYKVEYGDSLVKVYVQTYDSLIGFFQANFIGVVKDTIKASQMLFRDKEYPYEACSATFKLPLVDKIVLFGSFGRMPTIIPKVKKSNYFLLQYNLSPNWDYQYFKDFKIKIADKKLILGDKRGAQTVLAKWKHRR